LVRKYADLEVVCGRAQVQLGRAQVQLRRAQVQLEWTSLRAGDEIERVRGKRVRAWKREG
jgi:hypothetical protein